MNGDGGTLWRRLALAALSLLILGLLALSVSEGAIYLSGTKVDRAEQPVLFWLEAAGVGLVGLGVLYVALFGARWVAPAATRRS